MIEKVAPSDKAQPEPPQETPSGSADIASVYLEIRSALYRYVYRYFRRSQEAEDVVQEAFVKVIQAQRQRDIQSPKSYLFRTARNLSLAHIDKAAYRLTDEVGDLLTESELLVSRTMEEEYEARENFEMFCRAVRTLPLKCRRVFVLCRVYSFKQKEVAARLNISLSAVEGHLSRATRRCIDFMEAEQAGRKRKQCANGKEW